MCLYIYIYYNDCIDPVREIDSGKVIGQKTLPNPKPWEFVLVWNAPNQHLNNMRLAAIRFHSKQRTRTDALFWVGLHKVPLKMPLAIIQLFHLFSNRSSTAHVLKHHQLTVSLSQHKYKQHIYIYSVYIYITKTYIAFPHSTVSLFCKKTPAVPMAKPWSSLRFLSRSLEGKWHNRSPGLPSYGPECQLMR